MSADFYKYLHMFGALMVFFALGAYAMGGLATREQDGKVTFPGKKAVGLIHGIAMIITLVAGFGMIAKMQLPWAGWLYGKLALWVFLGGVIALLYKKGSLAKILWPTIAVCALILAYLGRFKSF